MAGEILVITNVAAWLTPQCVGMKRQPGSSGVVDAAWPDASIQDVDGVPAAPHLERRD